MIGEPVVTALNATTYTAIVLPSGSQAFRDISLWTEDGAAWMMAIDDTGTGEAIVPADTPFSIGGESSKETTLLYARSVAGTPNLVAFFKASQT